jgi:hypothetical protein
MHLSDVVREVFTMSLTRVGVCKSSTSSMAEICGTPIILHVTKARRSNNVFQILHCEADRLFHLLLFENTSFGHCCYQLKSTHGELERMA